MAQETGSGLSDAECVPLQPCQPRRSSGDEIPSTNHIRFRTTELRDDAAPGLGDVLVMDTHEENPNHTKQLLEAIDCDNDEELLRLLGAGADPNATYPLSPRQQEYLQQVVWDEDGDDCKRKATWEGGSPAWSVLHFASAACAARCVHALLSRGARARAALAQRTPLDVAGAALYYGRSVRPDQFEQVVCALAGAGGRCGACDGAAHALHTAVRLRSPRAARALLAAGARAALDRDGLTPMHIAVELKCEDVLQTLLEAEPRWAAARARGASLLFAAVRARWGAGAAAALRAGARAELAAHPARTRPDGHPIKVTPLHLAVEINHVDIVDKILTLSKDKNLNCLNSENETPLCTAIERGHLVCVKLLVRHGASLCDIDGKSNALHVAAFYSYPNGVSILKYLLEETDVSDIINSPNDWHQGPIHRAVISGPEPVKMLLDKGADIRLKIGGENNGYERWFTPLHFAAMMQDSATAQMILSYDRTTIDEVDAMGRTPLLVAVLNHAEEVVTTILHAGGLLSCDSKAVEQQSAIEMITDKLPDPTEFFERCFDSSLYRIGARGSSEIVVDFSIFTNNHEQNQLKAIEEFTRCGQHKVLLHPVIKALLYLKWKNLLPFFYVLLGTYAIFVFTLNFLVGIVYYWIIDTKENVPHIMFFIIVVDLAFLYISLLCILITELACMRARGRRYWCSLETWVKLGSCALGGVLPAALIVAGPGAAPRHTASAGLLLAWLQLMILLARLPEGHYVLMIGKVATTIAKIFATFIFLVSAFALSFMVQFQSSPPFDGPLAALTKTFVMMTSEFEYENLFGDEHALALENTRPVVTILFLLFVVFVSVVMMNFIVGMAVSDINSLIISGNASKLEKQLEILVTLDTLVCDGILGKILPRKIVRTIKKRRFLTKMVVNLGTSTTWTVYCEDAENNYEIEMSSSFYQTAISKSRKIPGTEFVDRKLKNMATMLYHAIIEKEGVDPFNFRQQCGVRVTSKIDDILARMETLTEVQEDMCKLKKFYDYKERELTRGRRPYYYDNMGFLQSQVETEKV